MTTEEIINDIFNTSKRFNEIKREALEKSKKYAEILNKKYENRIGEYIDYNAKAEWYSVYKGGYFGGFKTESNGGHWTVVPIVYQTNKKGEKLKRTYTTFEGDLKTVLDLLNS